MRLSRMLAITAKELDLRGARTMAITSGSPRPRPSFGRFNDMSDWANSSVTPASVSSGMPGPRSFTKTARPPCAT